MTNNLFMKNLFILIFLTTMISCNYNKTYLTDDEKSWNPYEKGQVIIFKTKTGILDSILIEEVTYGFPDGLGVVDKYEILHVVGKKRRYKNNKEVSNYIFTIDAKTQKSNSKIQFSISVKDSEFYPYYYNIENYLMKLPEQKMIVNNTSFTDVIKIKTKGKLDNNKGIRFIYWSKSKGYVRLEENNGVIWDLKETQ